MEIGMILAFIALAFALVGFGIAISTVIMMRGTRKDVNKALATTTKKFWDAPDELITVLGALRKRARSQKDTEGNGPPHPPETGMKWVLDHTACDQGHYGHSTWKQVPDPLTAAEDR